MSALPASNSGLFRAFLLSYIWHMRSFLVTSILLVLASSMLWPQQPVSTGGAQNSPAMQGTLQADQMESAQGKHNGIAMSLAQCASQPYACMIQAPALYSLAEAQPFGGPAVNYYPPFVKGPSAADPVAGFLDMRYGVPQWTFNGARAISNRFMASPTFSMIAITSPGQGLSAHYPDALHLIATEYAGGRNLNEIYGDKTDVSNLYMKSYKYTQAQASGDIHQIVHCLGNGDCIGHAIDTITYGGPNTMGDEGNESMRFQVIEGGRVFSATLASMTAGSDGSLTLTTTSQVNNGFQGEGRLLIDLSHVYEGAAHGSYVASFSSTGGNEVVSCGGNCGWDSTFGNSMETRLTATIGNGTSTSNTFPQSNVTLQVASSTGFTAGNLACVWDNDYECEKITAVGSGTVTIAIDRLPHPSGAYVTTGGLAGYAIEFEADRVSPSNTNGVATMPDSTLNSTVRLAIPIMYNPRGNSLLLFEGGYTVPGGSGGYTGRAYSRMAGSGGSCSVTVRGGAVTSVSVNGGAGYLGVQAPPQLVLSGITYSAAPQVYVSGISGGALTAASIYSAGAGISGRPACTVVTSNPYDIYPAAKVTGVYNATEGAVDGTLTTEPFAGAVAVSDSLEEPHYFWQRMRGSNNVVGSYIPSLLNGNNAGHYISLVGVTQGNDAGLVLRNGSDPTLYRGYIAAASRPWTIGRGQEFAPYGVQLIGPFGAGLTMTTPPLGSPSGLSGALVVRCGTVGCANWTSTYNVIGVQGSGPNGDGLSYNPSTRAWVLTGSSFSLRTSGGEKAFAPSGGPTPRSETSGVAEASPAAAAFSELTDGPEVELATRQSAATNASLRLNRATSRRVLNITGLVSGASFTLILWPDAGAGEGLVLGSGCTWYLGTAQGYVPSTSLRLTAPSGGANILSALYDGANCFASLK
jgi:hypothetical protein